MLSLAGLNLNVSVLSGKIRGSHTFKPIKDIISKLYDNWKRALITCKVCTPSLI